jgi:hypothetical protein
MNWGNELGPISFDWNKRQKDGFILNGFTMNGFLGEECTELLVWSQGFLEVARGGGEGSS